MNNDEGRYHIRVLELPEEKDVDGKIVFLFLLRFAPAPFNFSGFSPHVYKPYT